MHNARLERRRAARGAPILAIGAGYSSLARLQQLPFSELKIDRSYVSNCHEDKVNAGLCETIAKLAQRFELNAVAEGIEKGEESETLQAIGCDIGKGYLFAKPMPKAAFLKAISRRMVGGRQPAAGAAVKKLTRGAWLTLKSGCDIARRAAP